jgi:hypothetical protein
MFRYHKSKLPVVPQSVIDAGLQRARRERSTMFYQLARGVRQAVGQRQSLVAQSVRPLLPSLTGR